MKNGAWIPFGYSLCVDVNKTSPSLMIGEEDL